MEKYIHYGHREFDKDLFLPIRNDFPFSKPKGGLWASNVAAQFGWKELCDDMQIKECNKENCFVFAIKESAEILSINTSNDLNQLPHCENTDVFGSFPWISLDFEKLAEKYDAIELNISADYQGLYFALYGWDCDCILIMNPDIVQVL